MTIKPLIAIIIFILAGLTIVASDTSNADDGKTDEDVVYEITCLKGQTWSWIPTFADGVYIPDAHYNISVKNSVDKSQIVYNTNSYNIMNDYSESDIVPVGNKCYIVEKTTDTTIDTLTVTLVDDTAQFYLAVDDYKVGEYDIIMKSDKDDAFYVLFKFTIMEHVLPIESLTVSASEYAQPSANAYYDTTSEYVSVMGSEIILQIPQNYEGMRYYYFNVKAETSEPTQISIIKIKVSTTYYDLSYIDNYTFNIDKWNQYVIVPTPTLTYDKLTVNKKPTLTDIEIIINKDGATNETLKYSVTDDLTEYFEDWGFHFSNKGQITGDSDIRRGDIEVTQKFYITGDYGEEMQMRTITIHVDIDKEKSELITPEFLIIIGILGAIFLFGLLKKKEYI